MATEQKALILSSKGAPFTVGPRPIPKPGPGQVVVKVEAAAVNPVDYYIEQAGYFVDGYPFVAGSDAAGTVYELGEGVTILQKGDRVLFQSLFTADRGTFQQYVLADATRAAKVPSNLSFDEAATVPLGLATAALGLYAPIGARGGAALTPPWTAGGLGKYKDQPALVVGGSSSVGQFAIQLLKLSGFSPIISTASAKNTDYVKSAGATHVIDYHTTPYASLPAAVKDITSAPVPIVYDAISSEDSQKAAWALLAPRGSLVVTLQPSAAVGKPGEEAEEGRRVAHVFGNVNAPVNTAFGDVLYAALTGLLESGGLKPNKVELLQGGLAGLAKGVERVGKREVSGEKLVARPQETP
ncbi:GroES-like protein [Dentipellis sp. KUC8613]|nr:GroES-like protein [Dentipellis sp. KUC8613]